MHKVDWDLGSMWALGLLLEEREVGETGAVEGGCSSILGTLAVRAFEKQRQTLGEAVVEEAPGRHHPSCSTVPGGVQGSRASSPPCKGSVCPTATQPAPHRREPQCLAPSWHLCAHKRNCLWRANT